MVQLTMDIATMAPEEPGIETLDIDRSDIDRSGIQNPDIELRDIDAGIHHPARPVKREYSCGRKRKQKGQSALQER